MESLLQEYEEFEACRFEITKMTSDMEDMLDMYDNLTALQKVAEHFSSESAQIFIKHKFSLEADDAKSDPANPTTGGTASSDSNKDGKDTAATGKSIWNRLGGLKSRIVDAFKIMQRKCIEFWNKVVKFAGRLRLGLKQTTEEVSKSSDSMNYQINGVCTEVNNIQLTPVIAQINGAHTADELAKIMGSMNVNLSGKVTKETITVSKEDFVTQYLKPHDEAMARVESGSERKAASNAFETVAKQAASSKEQEQLQLSEKKANATMSASNRIMGILFQSCSRLMDIAKKHRKENG